MSVELQGSNDAVPVPVSVPLAVDATDSRPVSDPVPTGEPAVSVSSGVDASSGALNEANTPLAALESKEMGGPDNDVELEEMDDSDTEPCLQSTRLANSEYSSQLTNVLLKKMEIALIELGISPDQLLPTMAVCDLYDILRKDLVSLLTLKTELNRKGSELNELIRSTDILHHSTSNSNGITTPRGSDTSQCSAPSATSCISLNQTLFANRKFVLPHMDSANKDGSTKIGNNASGPGRSNKPNYKKNDASETTKKVCILLYCTLNCWFSSIVILLHCDVSVCSQKARKIGEMVATSEKWRMRQMLSKLVMATRLLRK